MVTFHVSKCMALWPRWAAMAQSWSKHKQTNQPTNKQPKEHFSEALRHGKHIGRVLQQSATTSTGTANKLTWCPQACWCCGPLDSEWEKVGAASAATGVWAEMSDGLKREWENIQSCAAGREHQWPQHRARVLQNGALGGGVQGWFTNTVVALQPPKVLIELVTMQLLLYCG